MDNVKAIKKVVIKTLKSNNVKIKQVEDDDNVTYVVCDGAIIILEHEKRELHLSFHISMKPDIASLISLLLTKINYLMIINKPFIYGENGEVIEGAKAEARYIETISAQVIGNYINEQNQLQVLNYLSPENSSMN